MATIKKGILTHARQWWVHLRKTKREFWKKHRLKEKEFIKKELKED